MDPLFNIIAELSGLSTAELQAYETELHGRIADVTGDPAQFVTDERPSSRVIAEVREATTALQAVRDTLATRDDVVEDAEVELTDEEFAAEIATLAAEAGVEAEDDDDEPEPEADAALAAETEDEPDEPVVAAAAPAPAPAPRNGPMPSPSRSRRPVEPREEQVALTAAAGASGVDPGSEFPSMHAVAEAMIARRRQFGIIPNGTSGERVPIARANWAHLYPEERRLAGDEIENLAVVAAAIRDIDIRNEFERRAKASLTAAGGLCAPVTPYYQLQFLSTAARPVRASLAAFNADRGGIRFARPAALSAVTTGVGAITAEEDESDEDSTKTCQVIDCPNFEEVDVDALFHCLQFGNLGARTFPELVTQWTNLTMAAHARLAESRLLTGIDTASTEVTAGNLGLGAVASLLGQYLTAASGYRNRHRMDAQAVLRLQIPAWSIPLMISDTIRSQFERFDTDEARLTALFRRFYIEPSFYIDGADGRGQVFTAQETGDLLPFPDTVVGYLHAESSFLYLDDGTLELGLIRDSVLNKNNNFQMFGETWENVAFVGVEALAIVSDVCDSGAVGAPVDVDCPIDYAVAT